MQTGSLASERAVISWRRYHTVTHGRIKDGEGYTRWALLDDAQPEITWESPPEDKVSDFDCVRLGKAADSATQTSSLETTLVFVKTSKAELKGLAAATTGETETEGVEDDEELHEDDEDLDDKVIAGMALLDLGIDNLDEDMDDESDDESDEESGEGEKVDWDKLITTELGVALGCTKRIRALLTGSTRSMPLLVSFSLPNK